MSSSSSPCAACKLQRRKCTQECIFAPYFPADQPQKFAFIHKVFGASNVAKLLNELDVSQREDAVNSLAYEAEMRLRDPVYGCVGCISVLQHKLKMLHTELHNAKRELATYIGPQALLPMIQPQAAAFMGKPPGLAEAQYIGGVQMMAGPSGPLMIRGQPQQVVAQQQQQVFDAQQQLAVAAAREQQEMYRRHQEMEFNGGFDMVSAGGGGSGYVGQGGVVNNVSSSLALGGPFEGPFHQIQGAENPHPHQYLQAHHLSLQPHHLQMQQQQQPIIIQDEQDHTRQASEEKNTTGPSC